MSTPAGRSGPPGTAPGRRRLADGVLVEQFSEGAGPLVVVELDHPLGLGVGPVRRGLEMGLGQEGRPDQNAPHLPPEVETVMLALDQAQALGEPHQFGVPGVQGTVEPEGSAVDEAGLDRRADHRKLVPALLVEFVEVGHVPVELVGQVRERTAEGRVDALAVVIRQGEGREVHPQHVHFSLGKQQFQVVDHLGGRQPEHPLVVFVGKGPARAQAHNSAGHPHVEVAHVDGAHWLFKHGP